MKPKYISYIRKLAFGLIFIFPFFLSTGFVARKILKDPGAHFVYFIFVAAFFAVLFLIVYYSDLILKKIHYEKNQTAINTFATGALIFIAVVLRYIIIQKFNTPPASDFFVAFEIAKKWAEGPALSPQHFFFPHWGIYAIFLGKWMTLFGKTLASAKALNVFAASVSAIAIYSTILKISKKPTYGFSAALLFACWPSYLVYSNLLSGEHLFIMFFALAMLALTYAIFENQNKSFQRYCLQDLRNFDRSHLGGERSPHPRGVKLCKLYLWIFLFSLFLALANLFKETTIITIPIAVFVFAVFIYEKNLNKYLKNLAIITAIIVLCSILVTNISHGIVSYYAKGPINNYKTGYFISTGLNFENAGRYNENIAKKYVGPLWEAEKNNTLSEETYIKADDELKRQVIENIKINYQKLPTLFFKKFYAVWNGEDEINNWNFESHDLMKIQKPDFLMGEIEKYNKLSNIYFLFVMILATDGLLMIMLGKVSDTSPAYLFSGLFSFGFALALLVIEILTRYRSILYPSIAILASFGLFWIVDLIKQKTTT